MMGSAQHMGGDGGRPVEQWCGRVYCAEEGRARLERAVSEFAEFSNHHTKDHLT